VSAAPRFISDIGLNRRRLAATAGLDVDLDATYVLWVYWGKVLKKAASMYVRRGCRAEVCLLVRVGAGLDVSYVESFEGASASSMEVFSPHAWRGCIKNTPGRRLRTARGL